MYSNARFRVKESFNTQFLLLATKALGDRKISWGSFTQAIFVAATRCYFCRAKIASSFKHVRNPCDIAATNRTENRTWLTLAILKLQLQRDKNLHRVAATKIACVNGPLDLITARSSLLTSPVPQAWKSIVYVTSSGAVLGHTGSSLHSSVYICPHTFSVQVCTHTFRYNICPHTWRTWRTWLLHNVPSEKSSMASSAMYELSSRACTSLIRQCCSYWKCFPQSNVERSVVVLSGINKCVLVALIYKFIKWLCLSLYKLVA